MTEFTRYGSEVISAEPLWELLAGHNNTGTVDVKLSETSTVRVSLMDMSWEDALMTNELGLRQKQEIEAATLMI
jgi:hypothetical protein